MRQSVRSVPAWLALATAFTIACGANPTTLLEKGNRLRKQGKLHEASLIYRKAIQKDPGFGEAFYQLGLTESQAGDSESAYLDLARAIELLPSRTEIQAAAADLCLANFLAGANRAGVWYREASVLSDRLLAKDPRSYDGLRIKGYLALTALTFADAEQFFRKANDSKPMQPAVVIGWIQALFQTNHDKEAEELSWQLIRTGPADSPAYGLLYSHYANHRQWEDAERVLTARVQRNPNQPEYLLQLAGFYADRSRRDLMKQTVEKLHDSKRFAEGRLSAGDFYAARSLWDEALDEYEAGLKANPTEAVSYWRRIADAWLVQEKPEKASAAVQKILQTSPEDDNAKAVNAALRMASGNAQDVAAGTAQFQRLVEKNPSSATWHYALGKALAARGDAEAGRRQLEQALRLQPTLIPARIALAELSQARGDYQTALRQTEEILGDGVDRPAARLVHAVSLMYSGRTPQARTELEGLEKAYPNERRVRLQLAWLDLEEKKFAAAESGFRSLVKEKPEDGAALAGVVQTLETQGRKDDALRFLEDEANRRPEGRTALSMLAGTALRMRRADLALAQYQKLAAMEPDREQNYLGMGGAYHLKNDTAGAVASYQKATQLAPQDATAWVLLAREQVSAGRRVEAIANYRRALALQPDDAGLLNDLAYEIAETGGNLSEAVQFARRAVQKAPSQPLFADTLAWVYLKQKLTDSALHTFQTLTAGYPRVAVFHYHLGMAWLQKGDPGRASGEWKAALALNPEQELRQTIERARASGN